MRSIAFVILIFQYFLFSASIETGDKKVDKILMELKSGRLTQKSLGSFTDEDKDLSYDNQKVVESINNGITIFKNLSLVDSISIEIDSKISKNDILFYNSHFKNEFYLTNHDRVSNIYFINCKFDSGFSIKTSDANKIALLNNSFKDTTTIYSSNSDNINRLTIAYNRFERILNLDTMELDQLLIYGNYINTSYLNKLVIDQFNIEENIVGFFEFAESSFSSNNVKRINNNKFENFRVILINDVENGNYAIYNNIFDQFFVAESNLNLIHLIKNSFYKNIMFYGAYVEVKLNIANNLFDKDVEIGLIGSKINALQLKRGINQITFNTKKSDFIRVDTLDNFQQYSKVIEEGYTAFHSDSLKSNFYAIIPDTTISDSNDLFSFNIRETSLDDQNWFVQFDDIKRIGESYRINILDSTNLAKKHEIYTSLQNVYANQGKWRQADECFYEWKDYHRRNYWNQSEDNFIMKIFISIFNHLNWLSCGYGIKPLWIFPFAFVTIVIFSLIYFFMPKKISSLEEHLLSKNIIKKRIIRLSKKEIRDIFNDYDFDFSSKKQNLIEDIISSIDYEQLYRKLGIEVNRFNLKFLAHCFYFSFSTFTTIGMGDWYPSGIVNKFVVMIEGALGWLCLGLFITTYANILLR